MAARHATLIFFRVFFGGGEKKKVRLGEFLFFFSHILSSRSYRHRREDREDVRMRGDGVLRVLKEKEFFFF